MIKTEAITLEKPEKMMVTWDIGRRCNFDCTYCEASRHNNFSPHRSYEELLETFEFVKEYVEIYRSNSVTKIDFTGGEPTSSPAFWKLANYIVDNEPGFELGLTTNGAWNPKRTPEIVRLFQGVTVSYHPEANELVKNHVLENIRLLYESGIWIQVNVMFHCDYFEEIKQVCNTLKDLGVSHAPRPIGDGTVERSGWFMDTDGSRRRTSHTYTEEQQDWFFSYIGQPNPVNKKAEGTEVGRSCCGGRCLKGKVDGEWQEVKHVDNNFKGWNCSVNHYFLHIDQQTKLVYHHQTCQALHGGRRGPLGSLKDSSAILEYAKRAVTGGPIVCPNDRCGCGMCVPKAKKIEVYNLL